jgi:hypothetical protein
MSFRRSQVRCAAAFRPSLSALLTRPSAESHEAVIECGKFTYDVTTKPTREVALCARVLLASRHQLLAEECPIENLRQDPSVGLLKDTLDAYIPLMSGFTHNKKTYVSSVSSSISS